MSEASMFIGPPWPPPVPLDLLFHRFKLTIPLRRRVRVTHWDIRRSYEMTTIGMPYLVLSDMLYVEVAPGHRQAIPKALVRYIQSVSETPNAA